MREDQENCDFFDGQRVPQSIVDADYTLTGPHRGTIQVRAGAFTMAGVLSGTLVVFGGASARISGEQRGTVGIQPGASVVVTGSIFGTVGVAEGATLSIEAGGSMVGTLANDGEVVVRGLLAGKRSWTGRIISGATSSTWSTRPARFSGLRSRWPSGLFPMRVGV